MINTNQKLVERDALIEIRDGLEQANELLSPFQDDGLSLGLGSKALAKINNGIVIINRLIGEA